ncbi:HAD family hydrolase [Aquibacillus kalidii]|uniref:HAD family hydrolase n=1 Tax=Aquibacillus kalidii TaxID=2762597 RepID=UPI00164942D4|nr:HAD family hydrolase [Aquibacillus kalidii]
MIKSIFFDLDDTLLWDKKSVKQAFIATCKLAEEKYRVNPAQLEDAVREEAKILYASYETYDFTQMIGINPFEGLWGDFLDSGDNFKKMSKIVPSYRKDAWFNGLKQIGIDDKDFATHLAEQFPINRKDNPFVYEDTFDVLDKLKDDYQLLLLTNGSPSLQNTKLEITSRLRPYFDHIIISGAFGKGKPDPDIFEYALDKANQDKDDVIMVGDNLMTDILGSNRAGIRNVWINREDKPRSEVKPTYEINHLEQLFSILNDIK